MDDRIEQVVDITQVGRKAKKFGKFLNFSFFFLFRVTK